MKRLAALIITALLLQACGEQDLEQSMVKEDAAPAVKGGDKAPGKEAAKAGKPGASIAGEWTLVAIDQQALTSGGNPTITFEKDGSCWGSTGINRFNSSASFDQPNLENLGDGLIKLGPAAVTRMAGPPEAMALERMFLERLEAATSFRVDGDRLHLSAGDEQGVTFERVPR